MNHDAVLQAYGQAKERYRRLGVDADQVIANLKTIALSVHCWQGDDVGGFETPDSQLSGGGIQVTGNYPGKARNVDELRRDIEKAFSLIPGTHRLSLHAMYGEFGGKQVDRDQIEPAHFQGWTDWAGEHTCGLDFNGTFFSHPKADSGYTLASPDPGIRKFWIEHARRCREISAFMGEELSTACINNIWVPDGEKDYPADRMGYRRILKESLDTIFSREYPPELMKDSVETKLFGIGSEAFVVGSHEFYMNYASRKGKMLCLDMGHFHPTESVADKISAVLLFCDELMLHVSRPMRWDSDHIVVLSDEIYMLFSELVRSGKLGSTSIGLDFFDGSVNRIGAWAVGARSSLKGLLFALLEPADQLRAYEQEGNLFARLALAEQMKTMPFGAVWDYYCTLQEVPMDDQLIGEVADYEAQVLGGRK